MTKQEILIMYGNDPYEMIPQIMDATKIETQLDRSATIAIKPNLVVAKPSESGATTDPAIVDALITWLKQKGYSQISIIESAWVGERTERAFNVCGYQDIAKKHDVELVDLKKDQAVEVVVGDMALKVCQCAINADFLINIPVLKAHCQTNMTCALKNLKGCIPDSEKRRYHALGLHKPIAYLNKALTSHLTIVDGIVGDLTFEEGGTPVEMDRIIVGSDPVLVDSYITKLMGLELEDVPYIKLAEELAVGSSDIDRAVIKELNMGNHSTKTTKATHHIRKLVKNVKDDQACSACYGNLVQALNRLYEDGELGGINQDILIGQGYKGKKSLKGIGIGQCLKGCDTYVNGCPPRADEILKYLRKI
jgi:uncharacterized protein (DUF362 family)